MALWYFCSRRRSCLFVRATGPYRGIRRLDRWADFNLYILHIRWSMISMVARRTLTSNSPLSIRWMSTDKVHACIKSHALE